MASSSSSSSLPPSHLLAQSTSTTESALTTTTSVDNGESKIPPSSSSVSTIQLFETASRISLVTIAGAFVGYGSGHKERTRLKQQPLSPKIALLDDSSRPRTATNPTPPTPQQQQQQVSGDKALASSGRRRQPQHVRRGSPTSMTSGGARRPPLTASLLSLPRTTAQKWAISCCIFTTILETVHLMSPTGYLQSYLMKNGDSAAIIQSYLATAKTDFWTRNAPMVATTTADYILGGTLAGAWAATRTRQGSLGLVGSTASPRLGLTVWQWLRWGTALGAGLGLAMGLIQSGLQLVDIYVQEEYQTPQLEENVKQQDDKNNQGASR